ncbi:MAG: FlgD immunoglobulin-like domain containing protein [Bdellovibrionales bacterium]
MSVGAVSSLTSIANAANTTSSNAAQSSSLSLDFETYLKILCVQLQNQDPTNATDPNQFTQELIQMQINNNEAIDKLTEVTAAGNLVNGVGYINQYVRSASEDGDFSLQETSAEIGYTLAKEAAAVTVTIKNSDGDTVAKLSGTTTSGDNYILWDGKCTDGTTATDGAYTFSISATDSTKSTVSVTNYTALFKVTAVQSDGEGGLVLQAGDLSLSSSDVTGVYSSTSRPAATTASLVTSS